MIWRIGVLAVFAVAIQGAAGPQAVRSEGEMELNGSSSGPSILRDCLECPEMIRVETDGPDKRVLFVGRYEVLWTEYYECAAAGACQYPSNIDGTELPERPSSTDRYPITSITPSNINDYLIWLNKKSGKKFRIPTEDEWIMIAVQAGVDEDDTLANYSRDKAFLPSKTSGLLGLDSSEILKYSSDPNDPRDSVQDGCTAPVGMKAPDAIGLYDLIGNLPEMVHERMSDNSGVPPKGIFVKAKGGGLFSSIKDMNLLYGHQKIGSTSPTWLVGYRLIRED